MSLCWADVLQIRDADYGLKTAPNSPFVISDPEKRRNIRLFQRGTGKTLLVSAWATTTNACIRFCFRCVPPPRKYVLKINFCITSRLGPSDRRPAGSSARLLVGQPTHQPIGPSVQSASRPVGPSAHLTNRIIDDFQDCRVFCEISARRYLESLPRTLPCSALWFAKCTRQRLT